MILLENQTLYNTLKELDVVQLKKLDEAFKMAGAKKLNFAEYLITH